MGKFRNLIDQKAQEQGIIEREEAASRAVAPDIETPSGRTEAAGIPRSQETLGDAVQTDVSAGIGADVVDTAGPESLTGDTAATDLREEAIQQTQDRGVQGFEEEGGVPKPHTRETAEAQVDAELAAQEARGERNIDYSQEGFGTGADTSPLRAQLSKQGFSEDSVENVVTTGQNLGESINTLLAPVLGGQTDTNPEDVSKLASTLNSLNAIDPNTGAIDPKLGNALALAALEVHLEEAVKRDKLTVNDSLFDDDATFDDDPFGGIGEVSTVGGIDTDQIRGDLFGKIARKLAPITPDASPDNPQARGSYTYNNPLLDSSGVPAVEAVLWQALRDQGLLEEYTDADGKTFVRFNERAADYYKNSNDILKDVVDPQNLIRPGISPGPRGETIGKEREKKSAKDISVKSKVDRKSAGAKKIAAAKGHLGAMPKRIMQQRLRFATAAVGKVTENLTALEKAAGEANQIRPIFDNSPFGQMLGVDKGSWTKLHAKSVEYYSKRGVDNSQDPILDANAKLFASLKRRQQDIAEAGSFGNGIFYDKWFNAASNGRLHVLNSVLNAQDSKLVRGFVGSARPATFKIGRGSKVEQNWKYIIAHNLSKGAADKGWNTLLGEFDAVRERFTPIAIELKAAVNNGNVDAIQEIMSRPEFDGNFADKGEWSFKLGALMDLAEFDGQPDGGTFNATAQTEHDGKQNGIAIQVMQSGHQNLMENIGVIYDEKSNTINQEDIRELMWKNKNDVVDLMFSGDKNVNKAWHAFFGNGGVTKNRKDLLKQPLMETSYGKDALFHLQSAEQFLAIDENRNGLASLLKENGGPYETDKEAAIVLNDIIGKTIQNTLNLRHQEILKEAAIFYASLGMDLRFEGPLGNDVYLGNKEFRQDGVLTQDGARQGGEVVLTDAQGREIRAPLGKVKATGQGAKPKQKYKDKEGNWTKDSLSFFGQLAQNQLPVLSIQNIDSAIMVNTINEINDGKRFPEFVMPIHDAIITDANSVDKYHGEINKQFIDVNDQYNLATAVREAIERDFKLWREKVVPEQDYPIGPNADNSSGIDNRALWGFFNMHQQFIDRAKAEGRSPPRSSQEIVKQARQIHPTILEDFPVAISGKKLPHLMNILFTKQSKPISTQAGGIGSLAQWERDINRNRAEARSEVGKRRAYQYN